MIKYIGSKRALVAALMGITEDIDRGLRAAGEPTLRTVADLFSGTARVSWALKERGLQVIANDLNAYAATIARCYVEADAEHHLDEARRCLALLDTLPPVRGYVTRVFCEDARYLQPANGARVDAVRAQIGRWEEAGAIDPIMRAVLLTSLIEAADRVDSTTGVQMAYLKRWSRRSFNRLTLRTPRLLPRSPHGPGCAWELEVREAITALRDVPTDLVYLDPPYNQHKYVGNYHVWETITRGDEPETYGVARKRIDCKTRRSDFNSVPRSAPALEETVTRLVDEVRGHAGRPPLLMISFSDEGHVRPGALHDMLEPLGRVCQATWAHARYIGARIGIHSPGGAVVGKVSHVRNTEHLFVVVPDGWPATIVQALQARDRKTQALDPTSCTP